MNRLILIGNGFDLAHKLGTSYCDFITDYIRRAINSFFENDVHDDPLLTIKFQYSGYTHAPKDRKRQIPIGDAWTAFEAIKRQSHIHVNIKSKFLQDTISKIRNVNWVDLENDYFDKLVECKRPRGYDFQRVESLNKEFDYLKSQLEQYLYNHENENNISISERLSHIFYEPIKGDDIVTVSMPDENPKKILLLSFNYTTTVKKYVENVFGGIPIRVIYIHGELNSSTNPLIFGFGDEYNKNYLEFEEIRNKELLKHIKSFGYFKSSNYHDLIRFLEDANFQVYVLGHSLGLSDRTMLKQIFEHENCKSIKLFYHDSFADYQNKTFDISSHFTDKGLMRKKIVPFDKSEPMPQPAHEVL